MTGRTPEDLMRSALDKGGAVDLTDLYEDEPFKQVILHKDRVYALGFDGEMYEQHREALDD